MRAIAADMQDEIAADFPEASHVRVPDSGHYIQRDQPAVVIAAARRLAGCAVSPDTDPEPTPHEPTAQAGQNVQ